MSQPKFKVEERNGTLVLVHDNGGCAPASLAEVALWQEIAALKAENRKLRKVLKWLSEREDFPIGYEWKLKEVGIE